jgi:murein DD-endopeptidase MepM/ murein hydrolase activator NlpD
VLPGFEAGLAFVLGGVEPRFFDLIESAWLCGGGAGLGLLGSAIAVAAEARRDHARSSRSTQRRTWCRSRRGAAAHAQPAADLERIQAAIAASRERVATYEREQRGLLEAIDAIDQSAALLRVEAARARRAPTRRASRSPTPSARCTTRPSSSPCSSARWSQRAVALYRAGELGTLQLLFSANGLRDFFARVQTLRRLLRHDSDLIARHREQTRALEQARVRAAEANQVASAAEATLVRRTEELDAERARKRALASQLGRSRALARSALTELEIAGPRARGDGRGVARRRADAVAAPVPAGPPFPTLRGRLPDPVHGALLGTSGASRADARSATFRKGVVWEAPVGTPVYAVAAGRVRYAGRFRGYGNVVILDHGSDHFTVSAHLDGSTSARRSGRGGRADRGGRGDRLARGAAALLRDPARRRGAGSGGMAAPDSALRRALVRMSSFKRRSPASEDLGGLPMLTGPGAHRP